MERSGKEAWDALTKAKQTLTAGLAELDIASFRVRDALPIRMTHCEHCRYCRDMGWDEGHRLYCTWRQERTGEIDMVLDQVKPDGYCYRAEEG